MKFAFCLFKYFPYGGLQRDFLRIANALALRGHEIHVYTMKWEGPLQAGFHVHQLKVSGLQNHTRTHSFVKKLSELNLSTTHHLVIGFNKMPYLDVYYAADVCYQARVREKHGFLYRLLPRYRQWLAYETKVFEAGAKTQILLIAPREEKIFRHFYDTEIDRFHHLPPGIAKDRMRQSDACEIRKKLRETDALHDQDFLLLFLGSGFKTKGLDRTLTALAALPHPLKSRTHLWVVGKDDPRFFERLAQRLGVKDRVHFLGGKENVPHYLWAADLLIHPAYHENTGTVLLEALAAGLPVLTVDTCGYAKYVEEASAGCVLSSPFMQTSLNSHLEKMLLSEERKRWQQNALSFALDADIYSLPEKAADLIECIGKSNDICHREH